MFRLCESRIVLVIKLIIRSEQSVNYIRIISSVSQKEFYLLHFQILKIYFCFVFTPNLLIVSLVLQHDIKIVMVNLEDIMSFYITIKRNGTLFQEQKRLENETSFFFFFFGTEGVQGRIINLINHSQNTIGISSRVRIASRNPKHICWQSLYYFISHHQKI